MATMGVEAVGAYIAGLVAAQSDLTVAGVTRAADVQPNYIWRLEHGEVKEPAARIIAKLVTAARGNIELAMRLILDGTATADQGRAAALAAQPPPLKPELEAMLRGLPDDDLDAVSAIVARLLERR